MPPGFDSLRKFQTSRTAESDSHERPGVMGLRTSASRHEVHRDQYATHQSIMQTPKYARIKLLQEDTPRTKKRSVADLRKSFERASQSSVDGTTASPSLPFSKSFPQYNSMVAGSLPTTPRKSGPEGNYAVPSRIDRGDPIGHTQSCSRVGGRAGRSQGPGFVVPRMKHTTSSENSTTTTIHSSARASRDSVRPLLHPSSDAKTFRGARGRQPEDQNLASRARNRLSVPGSVAPPLLVSRSLSVKISTVPQTPGRGSLANTVTTAPEGTTTSSHSGLPSKKVTDLRKVFDQPHASAPFLPFMAKRRETDPAKSGPSLPIMVSTTVAVTTCRNSSGSRSSGYSASISSEGNNKKRRGSRRVKSIFQDGAGERPARHPRSKLKKNRRESPVKDRISLFEYLSHSASTITSLSGSSRPKSYDANSGSKRTSLPTETASKATENDLKLGARFMRAFSFGGRRKSALAKGKMAEGSGGKHSNVSGDVKKKSKTSIFSVATPTGKSQTSSFFVKGTMWKVPKKADSITREVSRENSADHSVSSAEIFDTSPADELLATSYNHQASVTKSGRILPARKSYGALQQKPNWEAQDVHDVNFTNPWDRHSNLRAAPRTSVAPVSVIDRSRTPTHPLPPVEPVGTTPTTITSETVATWRKSRYPSSFGKTAGKNILSGINKRAGVACPPLLSPDEVLGQPAKPTRRLSGLGWGQRAAGAAAAAFGIGQRLNNMRDGRGSTTKDQLGADDAFPGGMCGGNTGVGVFTPTSGRAASVDSGRVTPCSFHDE